MTLRELLIEFDVFGEQPMQFLRINFDIYGAITHGRVQ